MTDPTTTEILEALEFTPELRCDSDHDRPATVVGKTSCCGLLVFHCYDCRHRALSNLRRLFNLGLLVRCKACDQRITGPDYLKWGQL